MISDVERICGQNTVGCLAAAVVEQPSTAWKLERNWCYAANSGINEEINDKRMREVAREEALKALRGISGRSDKALEADLQALFCGDAVGCGSVEK